MPALYEITTDMQALDAMLDEIGHDHPDAADVRAALLNANIAEADKLANYTKYIKKLEMEAVAAKAEAEQYAKKAKTRTDRIAWLKAGVIEHLQRLGKTSADTSDGRTVRIQPNGGKFPVEIEPNTDPKAVPPQFARVKYELDKEAIYDALTTGECLDFAALKPRGVHLRID